MDDWGIVAQASCLWAADLPANSAGETPVGPTAKMAVLH